MSRVTVPALTVAFSVGNFAQIVRLGGAFIFDIEQRQISSNNCNINFFLGFILALRIDGSTLTVICWMIRALVELNCPQAIRGVQTWIKKIFNQNFEWISAAELMTFGKWVLLKFLNYFLRFEQALEIFSKILNKRIKINELIIYTIEELVFFLIYD